MAEGSPREAAVGMRTIRMPEPVCASTLLRPSINLGPTIEGGGKCPRHSAGEAGGGQ